MTVETQQKKKKDEKKDSKMIGTVDKSVYFYYFKLFGRCLLLFILLLYLLS